MGSFTNTTEGFLKKKPKTALAAALVLGTSISFAWKDSSDNQIGILTDRGNLALSGSIVSNTGATLGWTIQTGANTSCVTTCDYACVLGWDTSGTQADMVNCSGATADECLCAGPS